MGKTVESLRHTAASAMQAMKKAMKDGRTEGEIKAAEDAFWEAHEACSSQEAKKEKDDELNKLEKFYLEPEAKVRYKGKHENPDKAERGQEAMSVYLTHGRFGLERCSDVLIAGGHSSEQAKTEIAKARQIHQEAFEAYITAPNKEPDRHALAVLEKYDVGPAEQHTFMAGDSTRGGFLVPEDRREEILRDIPGARVMRGICRVEQTTGDSIIWPVVRPATVDPTIRTSRLTTARYSTEDAEATRETSDDLFAESEIRLHTWQGNAAILTRKMLRLAKNIEGIVLSELFNVFTADEDSGYIVGTGAGEPFGIFNDPTIATANTGHATQLTVNGILDWIYSLPAQYARNAKILLRRISLRQFATLQNPTSGDYIWDPSKTPNEILGHEFVQSDFVDIIGVNLNSPAMLGDFKYGYVIAEGEDFRVLRMEEWAPPHLAYLPIAETGGKCVRPAAFVRLITNA